KKILWRKFLFVSPLAAITTAFDITFGKLAENKEQMNRFEKMMREVQALANKFGVLLTDKDVMDSLAMLSNFPYESKSSLQLDHKNRRDKNEKHDLIGFVIENGDRFCVNVDQYKEMTTMAS